MDDLAATFDNESLILVFFCKWIRRLNTLWLSHHGYIVNLSQQFSLTLLTLLTHISLGPRVGDMSAGQHIIIHNC